MKKPFFVWVAIAAASLASSAVAQDAKNGDGRNGEKKAAMCIGCHGIPGYQASFPEVYKVPMIGGQGAKYIVSALNAYKKGERRHPTMRAIAASLSDQDMADLAAYYESQGKPNAAAPAVPTREPSPVVAELLKKGNCVSCHGANFDKPIDPSYPKLAGQHADYLFYALKAYQVDNNAQVGRKNPIMMGMARPFTHAELKMVGQYLASLPSELRTNAPSEFK